MNKQTEALKMAIEQLNEYRESQVICATNLGLEERWATDDIDEALQACKEALAQPSIAELNDEYLRDTHVAGLEQPAQEPVAIVESHYGFTDAIVTFLTENNEQLPIGTLLYADHAPSWQGLSDNELSELFAKCGWVEEGDNLHTLGFYKHARMLEQALKEKNTL